MPACSRSPCSTAWSDTLVTDAKVSVCALLSSVLGAIIGSIWLYTRGRDRATPIPFGPYLAIAGWLYFMWGAPVVEQYLVLSGLR